ncbi:hypothetical protein JTB14_011106 [Gonioctena quinquepunctata]|nr:hypothetical protein JTB14_011106 [Gonioctena quinquepunctata]
MNILPENNILKEVMSPTKLIIHRQTSNISTHAKVGHLTKGQRPPRRQSGAKRQRLVIWKILHTLSRHAASAAGRVSEMSFDVPKQQTKQARQRNNPRAMPPIIAEGTLAVEKEDCQRWKVELGLEKNIQMKYTNYTTVVHTYTSNDHEEVQKILKRMNREFHMFSRHDEKTHAFILSGLDHDPKLEDTEEELRIFLKLEKS